MKGTNISREVDELLKEIKAIPLIKVTDVGDVVMVLKCSTFPPRKFTSEHIEKALGIQLPNVLLDLWEKTAGLRLFEDTDFGQWGLVTWPASQLIKKNHQVFSNRPSEYREGDLIIGEFLGDEELVVLRSDSTSQDYGKVLISLPIYPRRDWYVAADSIVEFLKRYVITHGQKYWETA